MKQTTPQTKKFPALLASSALCLLLGLAGCAAIPADKDPLPQQDLAKVELAKDIKLASEGWPQARWWSAYHDAQLDSLVDRALAEGPNLQVAASRIGAAQSALAYDQADAGVNVALEGGLNRQRYSANGLFPAPIGGSYFNEASVAVEARYQFDWWGKHKAQIAAALGEVNASRADYAMAEQALAAAVARSYFTMQNNAARLDKLRRVGTLLEQLSADTARRIASGLTNSDQGFNAEAELSYLRQQVAALESQNGREREALRALLGANGNGLAGLKPQPVANIAHGLPARLGMELLARRPDLQAARWRVLASLSRIDAAQAAFYPDIDLTGSFGLDALKLSKLLESGSRTLLLGPTVSLPLFDSRRLASRLEGARSERDELIADYNHSVFEVVREVAQAGVDLQGVQLQIARQAETLAATDALLLSANKRMQRGLSSRATVLNAEITQVLQQESALQLQGRQLLAEVALVRALGGGYRNQEPATASLASTVNPQ